MVDKIPPSTAKEPTSTTQDTAQSDKLEGKTASGKTVSKAAEETRRTSDSIGGAYNKLEKTFESQALETRKTLESQESESNFGDIFTAEKLGDSGEKLLINVLSKMSAKDILALASTNKTVKANIDSVIDRLGINSRLEIAVAKIKVQTGTSDDLETIKENLSMNFFKDADGELDKNAFLGHLKAFSKSLPGSGANAEAYDAYKEHRQWALDQATEYADYNNQEANPNFIMTNLDDINSKERDTQLDQTKALSLFPPELASINLLPEEIDYKLSMVELPLEFLSQFENLTHIILTGPFNVVPEKLPEGAFKNLRYLDLDRTHYNDSQKEAIKALFDSVNVSF